MRTVVTVHNDAEGKRFRLAQELRKNPRADMPQLMAASGCRRSSNVWYHLHQMDKRNMPIGNGVSLRDVINRLRAKSLQLRADGAKLRGVVQARKTERRLTEAERIANVVALAPARDRDERRMIVRPNGVKVIVCRRESFVNSTSSG